MTKGLRLLVSVLFLIGFSSLLFGEDPEIQVSDVQGTCEVRLPEENDQNKQDDSKEEDEEEDGDRWQNPEIGMILPPQTEISTGFEARLVLSVEDRGTVIIKPLTMGRLGNVIQDEEALQASMEVKTGTIRVRVKEGEFTTTFNVKTPRVVSAVKGSIVEVQVRNDMGDEIRVLEGKTENREVNRIQNLSQNQSVRSRPKSRKFYRAIETVRLKHLARVDLQGQTHVESAALLQEMAEDTVQLASGDLSQLQGGEQEIQFVNNRDSNYLHTTPREDRDAVVNYIKGLKLTGKIDTIEGDLADWMKNGGDSTDLSDASDEVDGFHKRYGIGSMMDRYFHQIYDDYKAGEGGSDNPEFPNKGPGRELLDYRQNTLNKEP